MYLCYHASDVTLFDFEEFLSGLLEGLGESFELTVMDGSGTVLQVPDPVVRDEMAVLLAGPGVGQSSPLRLTPWMEAGFTS